MSNYKNNLKDISNLDTSKIKIAFISADFNKDFVEGLTKKTEIFLKGNGFFNIDKYSVPGALEIPAMIKRLLEKTDYDLVYCFGIIVRGATTHYEIVCNETARGISDMALEYYDTAIIMGLLTCENYEQVKERINNGLAISGLNLLSEIKKIGKR